MKEVARACSECKLMRHSFAEPVEMTPIPVKYAFHKVGTDLVGPLQVASAGNRYTVTCIDYLSKWVEARALPDKTSKQVADSSMLTLCAAMVHLPRSSVTRGVSFRVISRICQTGCALITG